MRTSAATHNLRSFPVTSWQLFELRAPRPFLSDGNLRQGFPSCRIPTIRAATTPPFVSQASLAFRGVHHASTCSLLARNPRRGTPDDVNRASRGTRSASGKPLRALCDQNARHRPQGALHTRSPGKPVRSKFTIPSLTSVRPRGRLVSTAGVSGPDLTCAGVAASCEAQHEPRARCCANPARSSKRLRPLHGPCPSSDAVFVAIQRTHSRVPRRLHTLP